MLNFFIMVFEGFLWIASLSTRLFGWFSSMARFAMHSVAIKVFLFTLFYAFLLLFIASSVFFFYFIVTNIIKIYNLISFALAYISSGDSGDSIVSTMYYFLTISGITSGVEAFMPILASALLFALMKALYRITLFFYIQVMRTIGVVTNIL